MTRDDILGGLNHIKDRLAELETHARKLQNQNFADIVKAALARVQQLTEHADVEAVAGEMHKAREGEHDPVPEALQPKGKQPDDV